MSFDGRTRSELWLQEREYALLLALARGESLQSAAAGAGVSYGYARKLLSDLHARAGITSHQGAALVYSHFRATIRPQENT